MIVERAPEVTQSELGAVRIGEDVRFSLFSANGAAVDLCLFDDPDDAMEARRVGLSRDGDSWSATVRDVAHGTAYGYRVHGPFAPESGHRFNADKLLLDPYARAVHGHPTWHDALYDHDRTSPPVSGRKTRDTAPLVARSIVIDDAFDWQGVAAPRIMLEESVIYELHVKGFTARHPGIPSDLRGTYLGLAHPASVEHLRRVGVTAVELLPVHAFADDAFLVERGLRNYWGYNSLGFFAPEARYARSAAPGAAVGEFKTMVRELHRAGIEVVLDVVYNHSGETDDRGPTVAFRGIDNATYYRLDPERPERYVDFTGCGNTLRTSHPAVRRLIVDSLRYWVETMGVDGFRFDLAPALGRDPVEFNAHCELFEAIKADPVVGATKLIAESWDLGEGGYQVGRFAAGWSEWNDQYRDTVRDFWIGSRPRLQDIGARMTGSADLFRSSDRRPTASVNFVACHDGSTLADVIAYPGKRNASNGDRNQDGDPRRIDGAVGQVGRTREGVAVDDRHRLARNLLTTLLVSQGVPMLLAGDEMGRTQDGNNNAYCHDGPISWLDWELDVEKADLVEFVGRLTRLRRVEPLLRRGEFGSADAGHSPRIRWFDERGTEMAWTAWQDSERRVIAQSIVDESVAYSLLILINAGDHDVTFALPDVEPASPGQVERLLSSVAYSGADDPVALAPAASIQVLRLLPAT